METYVIFEDGLYTENYNPTIKPIPKDWDFSYGNFTGTKEECEIESKKMILKHTKMLNEKNNYVKSHYPNAPYESIHDY